MDHPIIHKQNTRKIFEKYESFVMLLGKDAVIEKKEVEQWPLPSVM